MELRIQGEGCKYYGIPEDALCFSDLRFIVKLASKARAEMPWVQDINIYIYICSLTNVA